MFLKKGWLSTSKRAWAPTAVAAAVLRTQQLPLCVQDALDLKLQPWWDCGEQPPV